MYHLVSKQYLITDHRGFELGSCGFMQFKAEPIGWYVCQMEGIESAVVSWTAPRYVGNL